MKNTDLDLVDRQLPVLTKTVLDLVNMPFGEKEIREYREPRLQLRNLDPKVRSAGLGIIFMKIANFSGLKGEIPDINKEDITELLMTRFPTLSLNEIQYAFKIDRYGYHGDPTQHFQLFNAEYVVRVLNKYLEYSHKVKIVPKRI